MGIKTFEYNKNDIKMLRNDLIFRSILCGLLAIVSAWQGYMLAMEIIGNGIDQFKIISTAFVFATAFVYIILGLIYIDKDRKIIKVVKTKGKCVSSVAFIFSTKKTGFVKLYRIVTVFLTMLTLFILIASIVFCILRYTFFKEISYFYPVLLNLCLIGFYSTLHIWTEIKLQEKVTQINKL